MSKIDLALIFVDFSKAFDSVDRLEMFDSNGNHHCNKGHVHRLLLNSDDNRWRDPSFAHSCGILQGDTLAPFLFIMVFDYIMRVSVDTITEKGYLLHPRRGSRQPAEYLTDTDFADDIALISQSLEHAQDLYLNETKTECLNRCLSNAD